MSHRYDNLKRILQLDPTTDYEEIVYIVGSYESPWLIKKSLEFALLRTYAVPRTSKILVATEQFAGHGQKRYDDTSLMLAGIAEHGIDSHFGKTVIATMNRLHGSYHIRNEEMLYVLSVFVFEPTRWSEQYGWRRPTRNEQLANYYFWREVGERMGIQDIPPTLEDYDAFNRQYERENFRYDDANHQLAQMTIGLYESWYPAFLRPLVREAVLSFMDDPMREAFGLPKPHGIVRWLVRNGLAFGYGLLRFMPPRNKPFRYTELPSRTYPEGFTPDELGAKPQKISQAGD